MNPYSVPETPDTIPETVANVGVVGVIVSVTSPETIVPIVPTSGIFPPEIDAVTAPDAMLPTRDAIEMFAREIIVLTVPTPASWPEDIDAVVLPDWMVPIVAMAAIAPTDMGERTVPIVPISDSCPPETVAVRAPESIDPMVETMAMGAIETAESIVPIVPTSGTFPPMIEAVTFADCSVPIVAVSRTTLTVPTWIVPMTAVIALTMVPIVPMEGRPEEASIDDTSTGTMIRLPEMTAKPSIDGSGILIFQIQFLFRMKTNRPSS